MDLKTYENKSKEDRKKFAENLWIDPKSLSYRQSLYFKQNVKRIKPDWLDGLYCNIDFPNTTIKRCTFTVDQENIFNGSLVVTDNKSSQSVERQSITLNWKGYVTRLYDGELWFAPIAEDAAIEGVCDRKNFKIKSTELEYGVWPGFVMMRA